MAYACWRIPPFTAPPVVGWPARSVTRSVRVPVGWRPTTDLRGSNFGPSGSWERVWGVRYSCATGSRSAALQNDLFTRTDAADEFRDLFTVARIDQLGQDREFIESRPALLRTIRPKSTASCCLSNSAR